MKVVHCPCGVNVEGETDDALVENVEAHLASDHPDLVGKYSRDQILEMAHEHCFVGETSFPHGPPSFCFWLALGGVVRGVRGRRWLALVQAPASRHPHLYRPRSASSYGRRRRWSASIGAGFGARTALSLRVASPS